MKKSVLFVLGALLATCVAFAGKPKAQKIVYDELPTEAAKFVTANFVDVPVKATFKLVVDEVPTYQVVMKDKSTMVFDMCGAWSSITVNPKKYTISSLVYPDAVSKVLADEFVEKVVASVSNDGMYYSFIFSDGARATVNALGDVLDVQNTGKKK